MDGHSLFPAVFFPTPILRQDRGFEGGWKIYSMNSARNPVIHYHVSTPGPETKMEETERKRGRGGAEREELEQLGQHS